MNFGRKSLPPRCLRPRNAVSAIDADVNKVLQTNVPKRCLNAPSSIIASIATLLQSSGMATNLPEKDSRSRSGPTRSAFGAAENMGDAANKDQLDRLRDKILLLGGKT